MSDCGFTNVTLVEVDDNFYMENIPWDVINLLNKIEF